LPDPPELSPWALCRFARLTPKTLTEALRLEGLEGYLPPRVVSLSLALCRVLETHGEAECERMCEELADLVPKGWLQSRRLRKRGGLRKPIAGETRLWVFRAVGVAKETSAEATTRIRDLNVRLCAELGLDPTRFVIFKKVGDRDLECTPDQTLRNYFGDASEMEIRLLEVIEVSRFRRRRWSAFAVT